MNELDSELEELKKYLSTKESEELNKRIYSLKLNIVYLKSLPKEKLLYIHVKLHNAMSYKKPFAKYENIKKVHDLIVPLLDKHIEVDALDRKI